MTETKQKTFPRQVREKYGDTALDFSARLGVKRGTVYAWERGDSQPTGIALSLLNTAYEHTVDVMPETDYTQLDTADKVKTLTRRVIDGYGDTVGSFARRIGVHRNNVERWLYDGYISRSGKALLLTVGKHPEYFFTKPQPII